MMNINARWTAALLLITILTLTVWIQYLIKDATPVSAALDENNLRLKLSDAIGFIKSNWESLNYPEFRKVLMEKLKESNVEAAVFDNKSQSVIFIYGEHAKEISSMSNEEGFGLSRQKAAVDGYNQLVWLVYRQNILLGALKIYIPANDENKSNVILKERVWISGIAVFIVLLLIWVCFFMWNLNSKQKSIRSLNLAAKALALGRLDVPLSYTGTDKKMKESFTLLDRTRLDLKDMLLAREKNEDSRKLLINYLMHDIRTPVASLRALTEGLADGIPKTEEAKKNYYDGILKKITELEKLTNDLFHHVNIEASALTVKREEVYCDDAMLPVLSWLNSKTFGRSLEIDCNIPHVLVKIDTGRMEQVLVNLITNAVKYTKETGHIRVSITKEDNMVVFSVEDDGLGISKEDLPFIFEHFFRGEKSRSREYGGTGLGLSIVKYIVDAHEGYIKVKSHLGEGSIFRIFLPIV